jgi:hypothetical protein
LEEQDAISAAQAATTTAVEHTTLQAQKAEAVAAGATAVRIASCALESLFASATAALAAVDWAIASTSACCTAVACSKAAVADALRSDSLAKDAHMQAQKVRNLFEMREIEQAAVAMAALISYSASRSCSKCVQEANLAVAGVAAAQLATVSASAIACAAAIAANASVTALVDIVQDALAQHSKRSMRAVGKDKGAGPGRVLNRKGNRKTKQRGQNRSPISELDSAIVSTTQRIIQLGMEADFEGAKMATMQLSELKEKKAKQG